MLLFEALNILVSCAFGFDNITSPNPPYQSDFTKGFHENHGDCDGDDDHGWLFSMVGSANLGVISDQGWPWAKL